MSVADKLPPASWSAWRTVALGVFLGTATGLTEAGIMGLAVRGGVAIRMGVHFPWMVPAAETILFLGAALVVAVLGAAWPRLAGRRVAVGVLTGLAVLALLLVIESLYLAAVLLLAVGVGMQAGRLAEREWARRALAWTPVGAIVLLVAVGLLAARTVHRTQSREAAALAALPDAAAGAPNILLLILDTVRAKSLGLYGGPADVSPVLDSLAKSGVVFERAVAPAPWTLPSHASMFTGHWPFELDAGWRHPMGGRFPTLAETLATQGYSTAGFVGNLLYASRASGLARGFIRYEDHEVSLAELALSSSVLRSLVTSTRVRRLIRYHELLNRKHAPAVNRSFLRWLDERSDDGPWFAFLNYYDAHEPYFPPDSLLRGRSWNRFTHQGGIALGSNAFVTSKWTLPPEDVTLHAAAYLSAVHRLDAELARLMGELERRGALDNTIVVVASDHGEQLGEGGLFDHNNSLYPAALEVPLLVLWTGHVPAGVRIAQAVSLRDIGATILSLVGSRDAFPGVSLAGAWEEASWTPAPAASFLGYGDNVEQPNTPIHRGDEMTSLVRMPYLYVRNGDGTDELYDLVADPDALENLAGNGATDSTLVDIRAEQYWLITGQALGELPIRPPTDVGSRRFTP